MLLHHEIDICQYNTSILLDDEVFKEVVKHHVPYTIYVDNKSFIDSLCTILVNYSPISINIIDYWNKDIMDTGLIVPKEDSIKILYNPFEYHEKDIDDPKDKVGLGFKFEYNGEKMGGFLTYKGQSNFNYNNINKIDDFYCGDESIQRYYINSLIGIQDKLAYTYMNNFYSITEFAKKNHLLRQNLINNLRLNNKDEKIFNNINELFTENRTLANKTFLTKKGTFLGIKYASKSAYDAQLQGPEDIQRDFYINIESNAPFHYEVESTLYRTLFENFVKPLSHPIGMDYDYKFVCYDETANKLEYVLNYPKIILDPDIKNASLRVTCLCSNLYEFGDFDDPNNMINCDIMPDDKIFATHNGEGLWEPIKDDKNILDNVYTGIGTGNYFGYDYTKYLFTNKNYLIKYNSKKDLGKNEVIIEYYKYDGSDYNLIFIFPNDKHCNVTGELKEVRVSDIKEYFNYTVEKTTKGDFSFLSFDETNNINDPENSFNIYEGFYDPNVDSGGCLISLSQF